MNKYIDEVYLDCKETLREDIKSFTMVQKVIALEESNGILGKIEMFYKKTSDCGDGFVLVNKKLYDNNSKTS